MTDKCICIGMVGAGRATELHMNAYRRVVGIETRFKTIVARRIEQVNEAKELYGFATASLDFDDLLLDSEIDIIDICTPPYLHADMIKKAIKAGKHVICEKPLTGYFGTCCDIEPIGINVSKEYMYSELMRELDELKKVIDDSDRIFMYAENFVYAPSIIKTAQIIKEKKSKILFLKGEESLKGSSSPVAGEWNKTGGGSLIRVGIHPLSAILWLKQQEAEAKGISITINSVIADVGCITKDLSEYEHRHIAARPNDVEDFSTVTLFFSDNTKALVIATDTLLGGSKNYIEAYCNDAVILSTLTLTDMMSTYFLDEDGLNNVPISEMLPSKIGWNKPFITDEIVRGYTNEMQDFMESVAFNRAPKADFKLAYETIKIIYAAYVSAETGRRITF